MTPRSALAAALLVLTGCRGKSPDAGVHANPAPSTGAAAGSAGPPSTGSAPSPGAPLVPPPSGSSDLATGLVLPTLSCRAITVKGKVTREDGKVVASGDPLDRSLWLTIAPGAELAVKHAETSRELVVHGPAHVVACDRGEERFLVTEGRIATATWAGARPGAEVLVATPYGAVVYGDARLDVKVDAHGVSVHADAGSAWLETPRPGNDPDERKVQQGGSASALGPRLEVKALVQDCESRAATAVERARAVLGSGSTVPLGERAAAHARARKAARIECAIAAAALGTREIGPDRDGLAEILRRAELGYRGVPSLTPH